ncbi:hypothetical protein AB1N83_007559 [Pleurotus pulmonarius]
MVRVGAMRHSWGRTRDRMLDRAVSSVQLGRTPRDETYISPPARPQLLSNLLATSPVALSSATITMRVALLVLAFAAVFVLASPEADKKRKKSKAAAPAADAAPPADAASADDAGAV